jgi:hypothetical protein
MPASIRSTLRNGNAISILLIRPIRHFGLVYATGLLWWSDGWTLVMRNVRFIHEIYVAVALIVFH